MHDSESFKSRKGELVLQNTARSSLAPSVIRIFRKGPYRTRGKSVNGTELLRRFLVRLGRDQALLSAIEPDAFDGRLQTWINRFPKQIRRAKGKVSYGQKAKVVNVFLKGLVESRHGLPRQKAQTLERFLHVPVDSRVHERVWTWWGCELGAFGAGALTKENTLLARLERREYKLLQEFFRHKASQLRTEPIWFDYEAWAVRDKAPS